MPRNKRIKLERFFNPVTTCHGKRTYATQKEAQNAQQEQMLLNPGLDLAVYKCIQPGCGGWHLTRQK